MAIMRIEVIPDTSRPAGGHAIIKLRGVALLPPGATFRIDPIDESLNEGLDAGWPNGDLRPLETRQTPDGIEMRIGPDVVDAPLLEPGTPVTISVSEGHVIAELVWPDLPVSSAVAAAPVVMSPSQMAAELAANERSKHDAALAAEAARTTAAATAAAAIAAANAAASANAIAVTVRAGPDNSDKTSPALVEADASDRKNGLAAAKRELEAALALEPSGVSSDRAVNGYDRPTAPKLAAELSDNGPRAVERLGKPQTDFTSLSSLSKPGTDRPETAGMLAERDIALPTIVLKRASEAAAGAAPIEIEATKLRRETIEGQVSAPEPNSRLMPFLAGAGAASLAAAALFAVVAFRPGAGGGYIGAGGEKIVGASKSSLADAFSVGTQSPRGEIATNIDLPTALRLANYNLHGVDRPIDRAEAEFWLKKAMSLTASHSQLRWAMTQLGALAAEPVTGAPDYEKARLLWEISAANGDPVAMCFLGTLAENGLGVAADRTKALDHFKQSKTAGGCPNSDESIARLSK